MTENERLVKILARALEPGIRLALCEELARQNVIGADPVALAKWFRGEYVRWLPNVPICIVCNAPMKLTLYLFKEAYEFTSNPKSWTGYDWRTSNEHLCGRVERYVCMQCHAVEFSGRENDVLVLMRKRQGRCGELAILFTSFCIALGWRARLLFTRGDDHLWTEVEVAGKWLPLDVSAEDTERLIKDRYLFHKWGWELVDLFALEPGKLPISVGNIYGGSA